MTALGWYHVVVFAVIVPVLALLSRRRMRLRDRPLPGRARQFRSTFVLLVLFGGLSIFTAAEEGIDLFQFQLARPAWSILAACAAFGLAVAVMRPRWRRAVMERRPVVHYFMPQTRGERAWWVAVSILAGISEEITWRGVQAVLLGGLTGSPMAGAVLSASMFGAAHAVQGWKSATAIVAFAMGFQGLYWLSGTLFVGMVLHATYDLTAGLTYGKLGRELGYVAEESAGSVSA